MSDRLWRHSLVVSALEVYAPEVNSALLSHTVRNIAGEVRSLLSTAGNGESARLFDDLGKLVPVPASIPRARYRVFPDVKCPEQNRLGCYGVKGGLARSLLFRTIFGIPYPVDTRDIDIIRYGTRSEPQDRDIEQRFMPRDAANGAGIELLRSNEAYFESRDLSINEVLWFGGNLYCSERALLDTAALILRPTRIIFGSVHRAPSVRGRTILKMVRLATEGSMKGVPWLIAGLPNEVDVGEFELAVELSKAFERGEDCARRFLVLLKELKLLAEYGGEDLLRDVVGDLERWTIGERAPLGELAKFLR